MYGRRGCIGLLVPEGNSCIEPEFQRLVPNDVITLTSRIYLRDVTPGSLRVIDGVDAPRRHLCAKVAVLNNRYRGGVHPIAYV